MNKLNYAPILLFTYKRIEPLKKTIEALKENFLAVESELYIFSDGPKGDGDQDKVAQVREYLKTVKGFKRVVIQEQLCNKGLASSIIDGITTIFNSTDKLIVLEDDLLTTPNFLNFMNASLEYYQNQKHVFSISGYSFNLKMPLGYINDVYFTKRSSSWGWATWKERWVDIDWQVKDFQSFSADRLTQKAFNEMGSDLSGMLKKQMHGRINSWAIRWTYHQFKKGSFTVYPVVSKVLNIGFGDGATHTKQNYNRFKTCLDKSRKVAFSFSDEVILHPLFTKQFVSRYSIKNRLYSKLRNLISF